ncbi:MAG: Fur family transcriptional regulator [Marinibacterium sp.]
MPTTIGFASHDHARCIRDALAAADEQCRSQKLQFTKARRRVLEILLQEHRALGAYDILPMLAAEGLGTQPPVVYRALDFLVRNGLAHRVELMNAYIACAHLGDNHMPAFLICRDCHLVAEADAGPARERLALAAGAEGFVIERAVIEVEGLCPSCAA